MGNALDRGVRSQVEVKLEQMGGACPNQSTQDWTHVAIVVAIVVATWEEAHMAVPTVEDNTSLDQSA